CFFSALE
ncbi:hypothetical protein CP8484711_0066B, partial [Chlamydia psittaci 84-8471/1]